MKPAALLFLLAFCPASEGLSQDEVPFTRLFDIGVCSSGPLTGQTLAKSAGWHQVPEDNVSHRFSGDAVLVNDKLTVVVRKEGSGPEVYSKTSGGPRFRATLGRAKASSSAPIKDLRILENSSSAVKIEAIFKESGPAALGFRLTTGEATLEIEPAEGSGFINVQTKSPYVLVPDYFGDDMVFSASRTDDVCLPAENFVLHLLAGGDAILMSVWQSNQQETWLAAGQESSQGDLCSTQVRCLKGQKVWVALLENPGLWRARDASEAGAWQPPFPAKWRSSLVRENGVTDSWDAEQGLGPEQSAGRQHGPLIVYPIDRSPATPITITCPTDVMRNTLGVGPCQYILACEGLGAQGDPTPNTVMGWIEKQFEQKKQKKAADEIKERLNLMAKHVQEAHARIDRYAECAARLRKSPADRDERFRIILDDLDRFAAAGLAPACSPERVRQLAAEVAALLEKESTPAQCGQLGRQLRSIGATQDSSLAKCRMAVRRLRAQARTMTATQRDDSGVGRLADQMLQSK